MTGANSARKVRASAAFVAAALLGGSAAATAEVPIETLDFEDQAPKCVVSRVQSNWGSGPIFVHGLSPRYAAAENAALVVDTTLDPPADDRDLRTPSTAGISKLTNSRPLYNALIISKVSPRDGYVASPDDEDLPGGKLRFDFSEMESGPEKTRGVTFHGLTLIDRDGGVVRLRLFREATEEPFARIESRPASAAESSYGLSVVDRTDRFLVGKLLRSPFLEFEIRPTRIDNSVQVLDVAELRATGAESRATLGETSPYPDGIPGVVRMEIELEGSGAVDEIRFRGKPRHAQGADQRRERDLWEELSKTLDIDRERKKFEKGWKQIRKEAEKEGARDYDAEIALLEETRDRLIEKLQCPGMRCGCPEMSPLRAWVRQRFEVARASVEAAREGEPVVSSAGAAAVRPSLARLRLGPGPAPGLALAQSAESDGGILSFIEIELWGPLKRVFGGEQEGKVTVRLSVKGCDSYRFSTDSEHTEKSAARLRRCGEEAEIYIGRYEVGCSSGSSDWRPLGTFDLVKDEELVRDGRVVLSCERTAELVEEDPGPSGAEVVPATSS